MSLSLSLVAEMLVAILLIATIATSVKLSRRMATLRADEGAMRQVVTELLAATDSAERSVAQLREAVADSDRVLAARLRAAEECSAELANRLKQGDQVLSRVGDIASLTARAMEKPREPAAPRILPIADRDAAPEAAPAPIAAGSADRLKSAVLAARAIAGRAAARNESQAA